MIEQFNTIAHIWWNWMWPMFWQVSVLIILIGAVDLLLQKHIWPQVRYALWLLVLIKLILPPSLSMPTSIISQARTRTDEITTQIMVSNTPVKPALVVLHAEMNRHISDIGIEPYSESGATMGNVTSELPVRMDTSDVGASGIKIEIHWHVYVMAVWLAVMIALSSWAIVRFRKLRKFYAVEFFRTDFPQWFGPLFAETVKKLSLRKFPEIALSRDVSSPAVFGTFRPVLVLPVAAVNHLSRKYTGHILLHELAHIKRGDLLVNTFYMLLQIVYWFNPFLWLLRRKLQHLRELCCDATVARILRDKTVDYRDTILEVTQRFLSKPAEPGIGLLGMVETSSRLLVRLKWLEKRSWKYRGVRFAIIFIVVGLMSACILPMAEAKSADVLTVAADGSARYSSIQEAIDAAVTSAVIIIGPGVYEERLKIDKPLTLTGAGWERTTIVTESTGADVFEEAMRTLNIKMQEAKSDEQRKEIANKFEAEFKDKHGKPILLVSDTKGVVIRDLKFTCPGRSLKGRSLPVPIVEFNNSKAIVSKCVVIGTPGDGVSILNGSDVEIRDSLVAAVWGTGIVVGERQGRSSGVRLLDSELRNCHYAGIVIRPGCDSTVVERCRISGSAWHGIRYDDCSPTIIGNRIFGNARSGIYASGQTAATVKRNVLYADEMVGMSCWFENQDTIEGNTFVGNKSTGLSVLGASKPIVQKNIFFSEPNGVLCGDIGSNSSSAVSDGIVTLEKNLFWNNEHKVVRRLAKTNTTEEIALEEKAGNVEMDPMFTSAARNDFSLMEDSPARRLGIGVAEPIGFESPWPLQPEEAAIIPDGQTRNYRQWKTPTQTESPLEKAVPETTTVEVKSGLRIKALIDGKDTIKISNTELWYEHDDYDLPGKWWNRRDNIKHDEPTYINGTAWKPEWQGNISKPYRLERGIPLREVSDRIKLTKVAGRGSVSIVGVPQQTNDYTLSILLDDNLFDEAQWYEFIIQWGVSDSQEQTSNLTSAGSEASRTKTYRDVSYKEAFLDLHKVLGEQYPCFKLKEIDWDYIGKQFLSRIEDVKDDDQFGLLCMELIAKLQDSHATLLEGTAKLPDLLLPQWDPGFATLEDDNGRPSVYYVDKDGPAEKTGVKVGMIVLSIDGQDAQEAIKRTMAQLSQYVGYSSQQYLQYHAYRFFIRRIDRGKIVKLKMRDHRGKMHDFEIPATLKFRYLPRLPVPQAGIRDSGDVSWKMLDDNIGYIYVRRIRNDLISSLDKATAELKDADGLIIDVRGNSGGGFDSRRAHLNFALDMDSEEPQRPRYKGPMALLIDSRCISAGEGWASWFVAKKRATLFGEATAGASARKTTYELKNRLYKVRFPVKAYNGYLERAIERRGIEPDVPIRQNAQDLAEGRDTVLEAAKKNLLDF